MKNKLPTKPTLGEPEYCEDPSIMGAIGSLGIAMIFVSLFIFILII